MIEYEDRSRYVAAGLAAIRIIDIRKRQESVCAYECKVPYFIAERDEDLSLVFVNDEPYHKLCAQKAQTCPHCNLLTPRSPNGHFELNHQRACIRCVERKGVPAARLKALEVLKALAAVEQDGVRVLRHVTAFMDIVARARTRTQLIDAFEQMCSIHYEIGVNDLSLSKLTRLAILQFDVIASKQLFAELDHPAVKVADLLAEKFFAIKRALAAESHDITAS